jgi:hypothetical protein
MDDIERAAIRDEDYDPDDPEVAAALDGVRAELAAVRRVCREQDGILPGAPVFQQFRRYFEVP